MSNGQNTPTPSPATPAASDGGAQVTNSSSAPADEGTNFFEMMGSTDDLDIVEVQPDVVTDAPAAPATPASATPTPAAQTAPATPATAPAAPPKEEPKPAQAQQQPAPAPTPPPAQAQPQQQQAPAPEQPASTPSDTPQGLAETLAQHHAQLVDATASRFALSKDEADLFDTAPGEAIPKFGARIYLEAVNATLHHIQNFVPRMVEQSVRQMEAVRENEAAFYKQFPSLDRAKHHKDIVQFGKAFRANAPTQADLFAMIGAAVMAKYGIQPGVAAPTAGAPASPQPTLPVSAPPFAPAQGGPGVVSVIPIEESPFAGLGQDYEN